MQPLKHSFLKMTLKYSLLAAMWCLSLASFAQGSYKLDGNNLVLPAPFVFKTGTDNLAPESDKMLDYLKTYLDAKTTVTLLRIEGHVSDVKDAEQAQKLSEKRANAVVKALVKRGVDCKRLLPVGFGNTKPIESNNSAVGKAKNTRIVIANAELRGKAIGGFPIEGGGKVAGSPCEKR